MVVAATAPPRMGDQSSCGGGAGITTECITAWLLRVYVIGDVGMGESEMDLGTFVVVQPEDDRLKELRFIFRCHSRFRRSPT